MKSAAIFISLLGHIAVFSVFSFSFGYKPFEANFGDISFLGAILKRSDLIWPDNLNARGMRNLFIGKTKELAWAKTGLEPHTLSGYLRPALTSGLNEEKKTFLPQLIWDSSFKAKTQPVIMFYPRLPYHFILYFKDRQTVHLELMFNIIPRDGKSSIVIKRKISSGNLEADLISMRYISRYLFIQQMGFIPNNWQIVKIDLSQKND